MPATAPHTAPRRPAAPSPRAAAPVPQDVLRPYRWNVEQYHRMGEASVFEPGTRVELLGGVIYEQADRGERHSVPVEEQTGGVWPYRWTRAEYERLVEAGVFPPDTHAELLGGEVYEMSPQGSRHATTLRAVEETLRELFRSEDGYDFRIQLPLAAADHGEPEPDISVVRGHYADFMDEHPRTAELVVEISRSSLQIDREVKAVTYARAGVTEYWIVNLVERVLEVYREPAGETYRQKQTFTPGATVSPLARPDARIPVADLLP